MQGIVVVSLPVTAVQMWIIAFKFVRASKVVHKVLGLGTAKNNANTFISILVPT
jgi:hypothetical protein